MALEWVTNGIGETRQVDVRAVNSPASSAVFKSGARSSEAKPRYDLIPACALEREAVRMGDGAVVHGENNYQRGVNDSAYRKDRENHLIEHAILYASGDRSTDHLAAIRANAGMLCWFEQEAAKPTPEVSAADKRLDLVPV